MAQHYLDLEEQRRICLAMAMRRGLADRIAEFRSLLRAAFIGRVSKTLANLRRIA